MASRHCGTATGLAAEPTIIELERRQISFQAVAPSQPRQHGLHAVELRSQRLIDERAVIGAAIQIAAAARRIIFDAVIPAAAVKLGLPEAGRMNFNAAREETAIRSPDGQQIVAA